MLEAAVVVLGLALLVSLIALAVAVRRRVDPALAAALAALERANERIERELREAISTSGRDLREETRNASSGLQEALVTQVVALGRGQGEQLERFGVQVKAIADGADETGRKNRQEATEALTRSAEQQQAKLGELATTLTTGLAEVRATLEARISALQAENTAKLEEMRKTVDERLQATLEARLGESFKLVSERLEAVHKGLGEMQVLATGVGDLKRVLTNVKTRGGFGEVQLEALLEQILTPEQYGKNVATRPGSTERVEFAIKFPGTDDAPCWLPIDAKFPVEDYERIQLAVDAGDAVAVEAAGRALEARVKLEAKSIREKYIQPPDTTDFGLLFLPTEGLYAEVLRRPGLVESLQREHKVVIAGPTTLAALLNSLQMGFRTLAIQKRSAEVWQVLGAVKTEFGRFGEWLEKVRNQIDTASKTLDLARTRTSQVERKLRAVEALPAEDAARLLPAGVTSSGATANADDDL